MKRIDIIPIGSGSTGNSIYIGIDRYHLLIDAGLSTKKIRNALNKNSIELNDIEALFITHTHYDHTKGIKVLRKHIECPVYGSKTTLDRLEFDTSHSLKYKERTEILPGLYVTSLKTSHDCPGSACYILETENIKVSYVTDLGYMDIKIYEKMVGSDLVIIESNHDIDMLKKGSYPPELKLRILSENGHMSNEECGRIVDRLYNEGTRHFLLAHTSKENNTPEKALNESKKYQPQADIRVLKDEDDIPIRYELEDH
ncbi:MAG: MBL fold metallo-hydrolase [Erysipelotrichaceae bacterium]|nr:MBL fold metallo-hydrolase [Erysipelotrichaceae bacterium]